MSLATRPLSMIVNNRKVGPVDVPDDLMMIDFLHEYLNLTGSRLGCGEGMCHACAIILDGPDGSSREIRTCITGAHLFEGKSVRTIEAHAERGANGDVIRLSAIQQAFVEHFSFQCGYCTPGFVTGATVLVEHLMRKPIRRAEVERTIEQALAQHICRCTGYVGYYEAVRDVILSTPGLVRG